MSDDGSDAKGVDTSQYTNLQALANTKGDPSGRLVPRGRHKDLRGQASGNTDTDTDSDPGVELSRQRTRKESSNVMRHRMGRLLR